MLLIIVLETCLILCKLYIYPNIMWEHVFLPLFLYIVWKVSGIICSLFILLFMFIYTVISMKFKKHKK